MAWACAALTGGLSPAAGGYCTGEGWVWGVQRCSRTPPLLPAPPHPSKQLPGIAAAFLPRRQGGNRSPILANLSSLCRCERPLGKQAVLPYALLLPVSPSCKRLSPLSLFPALAASPNSGATRFTPRHKGPTATCWRHGRDAPEGHDFDIRWWMCLGWFGWDDLASGRGQTSCPVPCTAPVT